MGAASDLFGGDMNAKAKVMAKWPNATVNLTHTTIKHEGFLKAAGSCFTVNY